VKPLTIFRFSNALIALFFRFSRERQASKHDALPDQRAMPFFLVTSPIRHAAASITTRNLFTVRPFPVLKLLRFPSSVAATLAALPSISESLSSIPGLKLARCPRSLAATLRSFTLITRTTRARASYLAALPSTRAIPDRDVFYVAQHHSLHS
jgi:hypothetical protein